MDAFKITIEHKPEGQGTEDNEQWARTFEGSDVHEVLGQIIPWALVYTRRRKRREDKPHDHEQGEASNAPHLFSEGEPFTNEV